jgi:integrase
VNRTFDWIVGDINKQLEERKAAGEMTEELNKIRFHDLRHIHETFLIKNRETPQAIAERLGWSDTRMNDNYAHIRPDIHEDVADSFGKSFYGTKSYRFVSNPNSDQIRITAPNGINNPRVNFLRKSKNP